MEEESKEQGGHDAVRWVGSDGEMGKKVKGRRKG
jgi:hypothetical protein